MSENDGPRRPFATGSKPGPDAVDHYLEEQGFYRKHVARDASSLYRVISEQVFDIQHFHEKVRQDCAEFMENHPNDYSNEIEKNFYNYISQLRRPRTYGSLLELRVMARLYKRNVILFEPTQNLQTTSYVYVSNDSYEAAEPLRVFYSHKDRHFDVIYTMSYVERLAESQSIIYSILYGDVFKLPDVKYAVERMLHDQDGEVTLPLLNDPSKYSTQAGEVIKFDSPNETQCVLKDPKTCHFHNQTDFEKIVNEQKDAITVINRSNETGRLKIFKPIDGFLYDDSKSCVRQLLDEKITPFPYKVAKALDPSIYRNTEFELWSENRREQRLKWMDSAGFSMKQPFDDKWMIENEKHRRGGIFNMRKLSDEKFEQGFLDESAYMALDDDMKKKYIILDPSAEPFKLHHLTGLSHFVPSKDQLELTVMPMNAPYRGGHKKRGSGNRFNNNSHQNSENNGNHQCHNAPVDVPPSDAERDPNHQNQAQWEQQQHSQESYHNSSGFDQSMQQINQIPGQNWNQPMISFIQPPISYQHVMPCGNFTIPPPQSTLLQPVSVSTEPTSASGDSMNLMRDSELSSTLINWKPKESVETDGSDLPPDYHTLQFYFNVGVRYFLAVGVQRRLENVASELENLELNENRTVSIKGGAEGNGDKIKDQQAKTLKADKSEVPPVPTNTPVTTKMMGGNYGPPNRHHNNSYGNNNYRRPFNTNRDGRDNREGGYRLWNNNNNRDQRIHKDIKFNSNVKNAPNRGVTNQSNNSSHAGSSTQLFNSNVPPINIAPASNINAQDKSPSCNPNIHFSPISPVSEANVQYQQAMSKDQQMFQPQPVQQYYQAYHQQAMYPQQGVPIYYQQLEDGTYIMQQQPQVQYAPYQYPAAQMTNPVYYPFQSFTPQIMDGSAVSSNDSGLTDSSMYQQQTIQYVQPQYQVQHQTVPIFYAQSPIPQTPSIAPIFPVSQLGQIQHSKSAPAPTSPSAYPSSQQDEENV